MRGTVQPSLGAAMGLLWGHLHRKTRALCLTEGSPGSGRGDWSCCPLLGFRCSQPRVPQCQELVSVGSPMLMEIFHQLGEPHGPSGSESPLWGERHLGLPRGRVRNLFTSISRYMRPFFFFFSFHYHSHSGESKHKQTNQTTRRQGVDGEGRATSMYMFSCSRTDHPASRWDRAGKNQFRGGTFPFTGCGGLMTQTWGRAAAGLQEAGSHKLGQKWGTTGAWSCPRGLARLPQGHGRHPGRPACCQLGTGRGPGPDKAWTSRVTANPTLACDCDGGGGRELSKVVGAFVRDTAGCL